MFEFRLWFHYSLFLRVQLTIFQHWFRLWLGAVEATSHYLNQWWLVCWRIYASLGRNELNRLFEVEYECIIISHKIVDLITYPSAKLSWSISGYTLCLREIKRSATRVSFVSGEFVCSQRHDRGVVTQIRVIKAFRQQSIDTQQFIHAALIDMFW